jgi:hypothetical protein
VSIIFQFPGPIFRINLFISPPSTAGLVFVILLLAQGKAAVERIVEEEIVCNRW